jgi:hypothetical protein
MTNNEEREYQGYYERSEDIILEDCEICKGEGVIYYSNCCLEPTHDDVCSECEQETIIAHKHWCKKCESTGKVECFR